MSGPGAAPSVLGDSNHRPTGGTAVAVLRLTRFKTDPADVEAMLEKRAALIAAVRQSYPGLLQAQLAWPTTRPGSTPGAGTRARARRRPSATCPPIPEAGAAFALTRDVSAEFADVVDER
jgi:hypothetical protein